jgi:hypothetical protein
MDRRMFGDLTARGRAGFASRSFSTMNDIDWGETVDILVPCWKAIPARIVVKTSNTK